MIAAKRKGFTLAELLIALGILGVVATFSIPKVLTSSASAKNKAIAKETLAYVSEAYQLLKMNTTVSATSSAQALAPYLNYIKEDNTLQYQMAYGPENCNDGTKNCYIMHNGSLLALWTVQFNGTNINNATFIHVDPDSTGPDKAVEFALYYNGRILDTGNLLNPTTSNYGSWGPNPGEVPDWFTYN